MVSSKWRLAAGVIALVGSVLGELAQYLAAPAHISGGEAAEHVAAFAGSDTRVTLTTWLDLPILLLIPAALYLGVVAGARTSRLAAAGAAITFIASLGGGYLLALDPLIALASRVEPTDGAVALVSAYESSGLIATMIVVGVLGGTLGYVLLGIAMFRHRLVARWAGPGLALSAVLGVAGQAAGIDAVAIAAYVIKLVASVACAAALLRMSREAAVPAAAVVAPVPV